jgi:hypothetical protein
MQVYAVTVKGSSQLYAFKQVSEDLFDTLINELECMLHLPQHPGIVAVRGIVLNGDCPVGVLLEHCKGGDLEQKYGSSRPEGSDISELEVLDIFMQVRAQLVRREPMVLVVNVCHQCFLKASICYRTTAKISNPLSFQQLTCFCSIPEHYLEQFKIYYN